MPKVKSKGLHFRVGQWHNKEELHDAIKPRQEGQLFRETTEDLMQEYDTDVERQQVDKEKSIQGDGDDQQHGVGSAQDGATSDSDDGMWGSDMDQAVDDEHAHVCVQGIGMLVCLSDGTFTGMNRDDVGQAVVSHGVAIQLKPAQQATL